MPPPTIMCHYSCGRCRSACCYRSRHRCGLPSWFRIWCHCGSGYHATNSTVMLIVHHCVHVRVRICCGGLHVPHVHLIGLFLHRSVRVFGCCCLGLERGDGWHKGLHLLHHTLLLGGIGHFAEMLLHLLFGDGFSTCGCCGVVMCGQSFDDLVNDGGGVCLAVEAEGIGRDG